jgi:predicted PurR-regulated permease PerM
MRRFTQERFFKVLIYAALFIVVVLLFYRFSTLIVYGIVALIFSYLLDPLVNRMQSSGLNRTFAIAVVISSMLLIIVWISTTILPNVGNQIASLIRQFNIDTALAIAAQVEFKILEAVPFVPEGFLVNNVPVIFEQLFEVEDVQKVVGNLVGVFTNIFTAVLIIPFATFFFLKDGSKLRRQLLKIVPNGYFETTMTIIDKIETGIGRHFKGVALQSLIVALTSWILLSIAGLNNALSVGLAVGISNTIPYFGPLIGYILSIIIAIFETGDFSLVFYCILAIMAVQILDNVVLQPAIFSKSADLHPIYILLFILVGAELGGIIGMLIAIPIASIVRIIITEIIWSVRNYRVFKLE